MTDAKIDSALSQIEAVVLANGVATVKMCDGLALYFSPEKMKGYIAQCEALGLPYFVIFIKDEDSKVPSAQFLQ